MNLISVNLEKCISCGLCAAVCPEHVLTLGADGPEELCTEECIACGHCVAVCPKGALDHIKTPLSRQVSVRKDLKLGPDEAENFLRSRRSVRVYRETSVPRELLTRLVNVAHYAQSGHNLQGVSYVIADDRKMLEQAVRIVIEQFEADQMAPDATRLYREKGIDTILRGAPCLILATAEAEFPRGRENSVISITYLELFAQSLGLGSCWAGLLERVAMRENSPLRQLFEIPENKKITGAVMVGYPRYSYERLVDRNPLEVTFIGSEQC